MRSPIERPIERARSSTIAARVAATAFVALGGISITGGTASAVQPAQLRPVQPSSAPEPATVSIAPVPFAVGEELTYRATFGGIPAGSARMRVDGIEIVRGRPAYHVVFTVDGGVPLFRVHDRYESWIDVETLASLRHRQQISEGRYKRTTSYEIYPERAEYQKQGDSVRASVSNPLDDGSFIYAVRTAGVRVGETRQDDRYFRPDKNPVVLTGVRQETVSVGAGTFATTVVKPSIRTSGIFSEDGQAHVWFTDDANRYPVQVKAKFAKFSLTLTLQSVTPGVPLSAVPTLIAQAGGVAAPQ
ncbi:MAG TPA: DUF3108 domain-containing protein [Gemmatimonadaceae bacterium]|nr:DUF3108 domain-containing protein [Gemmatimonadaceae bacterium]